MQAGFVVGEAIIVERSHGILRCCHRTRNNAAADDYVKRTDRTRLVVELNNMNTNILGTGRSERVDQVIGCSFYQRQFRTISAFRRIEHQYKIGRQRIANRRF